MILVSAIPLRFQSLVYARFGAEERVKESEVYYSKQRISVLD